MSLLAAILALPALGEVERHAAGAKSRPVQWRETSHADFADGSVDPQMYVSRRANLEPDSGCVEFFARFDANNDGYYDLPSPAGDGPSVRLFLGDSLRYGRNRVILYPSSSSGDVDLADLNLDGHPELLHAGYVQHYASLFWGSPSGPQPDSETQLPNDDAEAIYVYDLDKDGYLDILMGTYNGFLYIYWGSAQGYSVSRRATIALGNTLCHNIEVADLDKDGWGDVALEMYGGSCPIVYWGPGRTYRDIVTLPNDGVSPHGVTVADLNRDDWLDLVYSAGGSSTRAYVYWGSDSGFRSTNRTVLNAGECYGGSAAADLDQDGWLDLMFFRGYGPNGAPRAQLAYYNRGQAPFFDDTHTATIGDVPLNSSGGLIADLDFDGNPDIFVNSFSSGTNYDYIFWGPSFTTHTALSSVKTHHGAFREPGNVYDRSFTAYYFSSVYDAGANNRVVSGTSSWLAAEPPGSRVSIAFRSGPTAAPDSSWSGFAEVPASGGAIPDPGLGYRYVQYRATFAYARPCYLPDLEEIDNNLTVVSSSVRDVGVELIIAPTGDVDSGEVVQPQAIVRNYGTQAAMFPVHLRVGTFYHDSTVVSLAQGESDTVRFLSWTAAPRGTHTVKCTTALDDDSNPVNNARTAWVRVGVKDAGTVAILGPTGQVAAGDIVLPRAVVRNLGTAAETFDAVFRIEGVYADTVRVSALLPDSLRVLTFRAWTAVIGNHVTACSTLLARDMHPANDKLTGSVAVVQRSLLVSPDTGASAFPAAAVPYRLRVSNLGTLTDTIDLWTTGSLANWNVRLLDSAGANPLADHNGNGLPDVGPLLPGATCWITARVLVPANELAGVCDSTLVIGRSSLDTLLTDNARLTTSVLTLSSVMIQPDRSDSVAPGEYVDYQCTVTNLGNAWDVVDLQALRLSAAPGWSYELLDQFGNPLPDVNRNGRPDVGSLAPRGGSVQMTVRVTSPAGARQGAADTAQVWAISGNDCAVQDDITVQTLVTGELTRLMVEPDQSNHQLAGSTRNYQLYTLTEGNMSDVVLLSLEVAGEGWTARLLDSSAANGISQVGPVLPAVPKHFVVQVRAPDVIPDDLSGSPDSLGRCQVRVIGQCASDAALLDTATLQIQAIPGLAIHNFENPFRDQTHFIFSIPRAGSVNLTVYTRAGELVERVLNHARYDAGIWRKAWSAATGRRGRLAPGTYLYVFELLTDAGVDRVEKKLMIR